MANWDWCATRNSHLMVAQHHAIFDQGCQAVMRGYPPNDQMPIFIGKMMINQYKSLEFGVLCQIFCAKSGEHLGYSRGCSRWITSGVNPTTASGKFEASEKVTHRVNQLVGLSRLSFSRFLWPMNRSRRIP